MKGIKILLVEDDNVDQIAFKRFVKENNLAYRYKIASSVAEAKNLLKAEKYDAVIFDYMLGNGTAFDLFDAANNAPIIITTGEGNEDVAIKAMKKGAFDYLIKDPELNYLKMLPTTLENSIINKKAKDNLILLSHALMSIAESVFITDMDDTIIYVNNAFCDTYGYTEREVIGKHINILWKKELLSDDFKTSYKVAGSEWKGETYNRKEDGSEFPVYLSRSVIKDESGKDIAVIGIANDISDRKREEDEKRNIIIQLQDALAKIKTLRGLLPVCSICKKIRDDKGYWKKVEEYLRDHSQATLAHGLCPNCAKKEYPELDPEIFERVFKEGK